MAQRLGHRDAIVTATVYAHVTDQQAETASARFANAFNAWNLRLLGGNQKVMLRFKILLTALLRKVVDTGECLGTEWNN